MSKQSAEHAFSCSYDAIVSALSIHHLGYKQQWLEQVRDAGATEQQISDALFRQREDRCASLEEQLAWMREAGFHAVDCWFKAGRFATIAGNSPLKLR